MKNSLLIPVLAVGVLLLPKVYCQNTDAELLVRGVEANRQGLPNCSFKLIGSGAFSLGEGTEFDVQYSDGRFLYVNRTEWDHATVFQGGESTYYVPGSCTIRNPDDPGEGFLCDPRLFGLVTGYWVSENLDIALRRHNSLSKRKLAKEMIGDRECWKVEINDEWDETKYFWIDPQRDFRVLKCEHHVARDIATTISEYGNDLDILPSRITTERVCADGKQIYFVELRIEDVNLNPEPCEFDLASLGMSVGTPVSDIRIHERIGYWDGNRLVDFVSKSPDKSDFGGRKGMPTYFFWTLVVVGLVAFFAVAARLKLKR